MSAKIQERSNGLRELNGQYIIKRNLFTKTIIIIISGVLLLFIFKVLGDFILGILFIPPPNLHPGPNIIKWSLTGFPLEGQHIPGLSEPQAEIQSRLSIWGLLERDVNLEALNASQRADVVSRYSSNSQELRTAMDRIDEEYWSERKVLVGLENEIDETGTEHDKLILELYHTVRFESPIIRLPIIYPRSFSTEELAQFRAQFEALPKEELAVEIQKSKERAEQNKKNHEQIMRQWPRGAAMS